MFALPIILFFVVQSQTIALNELKTSDHCLTASNIQPHHVRIQHMDVTTHSDIVIDTQTPHFSWQLADEYDDEGHLIRGVRQIGYHIFVHNAITGQMMWDSTYVHSSSSLHIVYAGASFVSDTRYIVTIKYYTAQHESESYTAHFRTALLSLTDWTGQWIGSDEINMNQLRKVVHLKPTPIQSATIFISGIGYYHLYIEDQLIDPSRRLDPGWTTYQQRTLYTSYDVTSVMQTRTGSIGIGVVLGQGWYNKQQWVISLGSRPQLAEYYGPPRVLMQLNIRYSDGTNQSIATDTTWLGRESEFRFDSVYMGTTIDLRAVLPCWSCANFSNAKSLWLNASILPSPVDFAAGGQFTLQMMDPIRIGPEALHIATSLHSDPEPDVQGANLLDGGVLKPVGWDFVNGQLFDLGQNFAGWCKLSSLNASKSTIIQMRYAELRYQHGANNITYDGLYYENLFSIAAMDTVILNGTGNETFEPLFTSHGFRYILINGYDKINKSDVECYNAHSETTLIGHFSSASPILNQIQHNLLWSQLSNSMSLPYGCPQRNDRTGYLGDAGLSSDVSLFNFDYVNFYINFVHMIEDNQTPDGAVSDAVPYMVGQSPADPNWGTAFLTIPWQLYEHTGDVSIIDKFYTGMQKWLDCLIGEYKKTGLAQMYVYYGDWVSVDKVKNGSLVSSYALLRDVYRFVNMSKLLNQTDNIQKYSELYQQLAGEYHRVFYNSTINGYSDGCQTANILSLDLPNVVPESLRPALVNSLVNSIENDGHSTGGIISIAALFPLLSNEGHHDLALKLALLTTYPSYGYMFNNPIQNATTTWEEWNSLPTKAWTSLNHHMFNTIGAWFYRYLAGIELNALTTITIHPRMTYAIDLLNHTKAEVVTLKGPVQVQWTRVSVESMELSVAIPNNLDANILFDPLIKNGRCMKLMCDNEIVWMRENPDDQLQLMNNIDGISELNENPTTGIISLRATSGKYTFIAYWQ